MKTMKTLLASLLALTMVLGCLGITALADYTPGAYTASAVGKNGEVTVTATFSGNEITDISVESGETPEIGGQAMEKLREAVLAQQNLEVDAVSGASLSSAAFLTAMADNIRAAGADPDTLVGSGEKLAEEVIEYKTEADVIVIGAGGAGLSAALTAAENGATVIVLEKDGRVGGNTVAAISGIDASESEVQKELGQDAATNEAFKAHQMQYGAREELVDALVKNSAETADWLAAMGKELGDDGFVFKTNPRDVFQLEAEDKSSTTPSLLAAVGTYLEKTGTPIYLNMKATELLTDESGAVIGVKAVDKDGAEHIFSGKSVVLATGGFANNHEMILKYRPDLENTMSSEASSTTTGDGIIMAETVGAQLVDMGYIHYLPMCLPGYGMLSRVIPGGAMPNTVAIFVNKEGSRYTQESYPMGDYSDLIEKMPQQTDGLTFVIFDEDGMMEAFKPLMELGLVVTADSPEELAEKLGIDTEGFAATIAEYNAAIAEDRPDEFDGIVVKQKRDPIEGKLYGFTIMLGLHYNMGGVLIDPEGHVLNTEEQIIPNLFAAGEVTGGVHGTERLDGAGVADSFVFGRIAGASAAANAK